MPRPLPGLRPFRRLLVEPEVGSLEETCGRFCFSGPHVGLMIEVIRLGRAARRRIRVCLGPERCPKPLEHGGVGVHSAALGTHDSLPTKYPGTFPPPSSHGKSLPTMVTEVGRPASPCIILLGRVLKVAGPKEAPQD